MKKLLFVLLFFTTIIDVKAQDCSGVSCIASPSIMQEEVISCYENALDSNQYNYCDD